MSALVGDDHPVVLLIGWTLIHFVWQAGAVWIAFAASRALLSRSNCRGRYALGVAALAALAFLPIVTFAFLYVHTDGRGADALTASISTVSLSSSHVDESTRTDSIIVSLMPWLVGSWCMGVAIMMLHAGRQWLRLARIAGRFADSLPELDGVFAALRRRFGVATRVAVKVSCLIDTPMLIGWLKPVVLLPAAVAIGFPRAQLELVLAHELGHLLRYDHLVNLAQMIVETLLFYHPIVHWISRDIRDQRELCCDQLVVKVMSVESHRYARALASLEEVRYSSGMALAASGGDLVERVRRLLGDSADIAIERRASTRLGPMALVALLIVLGAAILRRVDAPTLLLGPITLEWPVQTPLRLNPLFAGIALVPHRVRVEPIKLPRHEARLPLGDSASALQSPPTRVSMPKAVATTVASESSLLAPPRSTEAPPLQTANAEPAAVKTSTAPVVAPTSPPPAFAHSPLPRAASRAARLVATRTVAPQFPAWSRGENGHVDVTFNIGDDGSVRNIAASGDTSAAFETAATAAMRQWRFDPTSVVDHAERFTQSFVFKGARHGDSSDNGCVRVTGSMICRSPADVSMPVHSGSTPRG